MVLDTKPKRPDSIHHKKRTGRHHKHTKPYAKAYWPYLPMLVVIGLGFILNAFWPLAGGGVLAYATDMSNSQLLVETNEERVAQGQSALTINAQLTSAAQAKANDMAARGYWSHTTPDGDQPWEFVKLAGYDYRAAGENLAYGFLTSSAAVTGWMNSPGHRANILNANYQEVGFGIANAGNYQGHGPETIVVAMYGTPASGIVAPAQSDTTNATATNSQSATALTETAPQPTTAALELSTSHQNAPAPGTSNAAPLASGVNRPVSRLQLVSNISPANVVVITLILAAAAGILILRHIVFWRRALVHGEAFIIMHWKADLVTIGIIVIGALLTRTAGFIQ